MHVLIVEPFYLGHRLNIAGLLLEAVARLPGVTVTFATTPEAIRQLQFGMWIQPRTTANVTIDTSLPDRPSEKITYKYVNSLLAATERIVREKRVDHTMIPAGDGVSNVACARQIISPGAYRQSEWETMLFRGRFAYIAPTTARERLMAWGWIEALRRSPMDVIHHMDPLIAEDFLRRAPSFANVLEVIPDPVDPIDADVTKAEARRRLGLPESGRIIGSVGMLDGRKGADLLIRAFATHVRAGRLKADDRLLLVGQLNPEIRKLLTAEAADLLASGQIQLVDRFVSDLEMSNGLSAMDVVATPYPAHIGSASIAIRAAAQRRPVLANSFGWLGATVPRFELGTVCDVNNADGFSGAIVRALDESADYQQSEAARQFVRYCSVANFQAHWVRRLSARLGIAAPSMIRWSDLQRQK